MFERGGEIFDRLILQFLFGVQSFIARWFNFIKAYTLVIWLVMIQISNWNEIVCDLGYSGICEFDKDNRNKKWVIWEAVGGVSSNNCSTPTRDRQVNRQIINLCRLEKQSNFETNRDSLRIYSMINVLSRLLFMIYIYSFLWYLFQQQRNKFRYMNEYISKFGLLLGNLPLINSFNRSVFLIGELLYRGVINVIIMHTAR